MSNRPSPEQLRTLGAAVEAARGGHRWSVEHAAEVAGITAVTWRRVELGKAKARTAKYAAIESVLGWPQGHCERILAGDVAVADDPRVAYVTEGLAHMSPEKRAVIADLVRAILDDNEDTPDR